MIYLLYTIHIVISLFLIAIVLLQQGKGADLSVFGGGATQTAFGARGATTLLHKLTVSAFVGFILTTLTIGILQARGTSTPVGALPEAAAALPSEESSSTPAAPATDAPATSGAPATDAPASSGAPATDTPAGAAPAEAPAAPAEAPATAPTGGN